MAHIHDLYDFTASAFILHPTEPKLCLHKHKKLNIWLQPGGHIELDEDPLDALQRELLEETGLPPQSYTIIERIDQPPSRGAKVLPMPFHLNVHDFNETHKHIDFEYLVRARSEKLNPSRGESRQIAWFSQEEINKLYQEKTLYGGTYDICSWIFEHIL